MAAAAGAGERDDVDTEGRDPSDRRAAPARVVRARQHGEARPRRVAAKPPSPRFGEDLSTSLSTFLEARVATASNLVTLRE
jgi:hypothetical protein